MKRMPPLPPSTPEESAGLDRAEAIKVSCAERNTAFAIARGPPANYANFNAQIAPATDVSSTTLARNPIVTPPARPTKRTKAHDGSIHHNSTQRKQPEEVTYIVDAPFFLQICAVKGGLELIRVGQSEGQDAFSNPLREEVRKKTKRANDWKLIAVVSQCSEPNSNTPKHNAYPDKDGKHWPLCFFVRMEHNSTPDSRKSILQELAKFLRQQSHGRFKGGDYQLHPKRWDLTPAILHPIGVFVRTSLVIQLIYSMFEPTPGKTWAVDNPEVARDFFNPPYPLAVQVEFGYEEHSSNILEILDSSNFRSDDDDDDNEEENKPVYIPAQQSIDSSTSQNEDEKIEK